MAPNNLNIPADNVSFFTPAQLPASGTAVNVNKLPEGKSLPKLFQPIKIRGLEFQNRIWLSPLCQYSAQGGKPSLWQMAHIGGIVSRGPGLTIVEASGVTPEGRITPNDAGIWSDEQAEAWARIVEFAHSQNQKIAIQIAHAGRKASTVAPWIVGDETASEEIGGWPDDVWGPSAIPFRDDFPKPKELTKEGIQRIKQAFVDAAKRAIKAGFDVLEIHNAHGYLLHSFLSPVSNKRTDEYGGSFENRTRLTLEIVDGVRAVMPHDMPLLLRISASDWLTEVFPDQPSWTPEDTARLAPILFEHGVDFLDVSSGGNHPKQKIIGGPAYQAPFAQKVMDKIRSLPPSKDGRRLLVGSVGSYTDGRVAEDVLQKEWADVILVGRQFQRNPGTVWAWADQLGVDVKLANQISWGFKGRGRL
ncbi:hypothetical protein AMATHDRAFT_66168 [Amanita thiersii Skay4041]|uniref:NADH:flavin oxidoreductase/NADH oxidase N-terminal domain-containing protein n=1 Tax=Amanita thiersii Skay4041 TaxID=703135 RepID=A0A2A9NKB4_9AGAR|nr:hypothetical protein AMATHDRAFT_66168 [Amanita thiersii Skay4041]